MSKPSALTQLLAELKEEITESSAATIGASYLKILLDDKEIELGRNDAELVLHSASTVEQLFEALERPGDCAIEMHCINVENSVLDVLERLFVAVDEI